MYSHEFPKEIDEYVNKITYPIEIVEYALKKPTAYETGEIVNLFIPDKNAIVLSRATVADMVDFNNRVIAFKIINHYDIVEIYRYLWTYMTELSKYLEIKEAADYMTKCNNFFTKLEKSVSILANQGNPQAKFLIDASRFKNILVSLNGGI